MKEIHKMSLDELHEYELEQENHLYDVRREIEKREEAENIVAEDPLSEYNETEFKSVVERFAA